MNHIILEDCDTKKTVSELLVKAVEQKDKSINVFVNSDGTMSISILPFSAEEEEDDINVGYPAPEVEETSAWRRIKYAVKAGKRVIIENEPPEYEIVNVYCPEKDRVFAAHWSRFRGGWVVAGWSMVVDEPDKAALSTPVSHWMPMPEKPEVKKK
jgi:hypothetical protein